MIKTTASVLAKTLLTCYSLLDTHCGLGCRRGQCLSSSRSAKVESRPLLLKATLTIVQPHSVPPRPWRTTSLSNAPCRRKEGFTGLLGMRQARKAYREAGKAGLLRRPRHGCLNVYSLGASGQRTRTRASALFSASLPLFLTTMAIGAIGRKTKKEKFTTDLQLRVK